MDYDTAKDIEHMIKRKYPYLSVTIPYIDNEDDEVDFQVSVI